MSRRLRPSLRLLAVAGAAIALAVSAAPATAAAIAVPTDVFLDTDAKPVLDWTVPRRYEDSWKAWNATTAEYNPSFVTPTYWSIDLNGCNSTSVRAIKAYTFTVAKTDSTWKKTYTTTSCRLSLPKQLPVLGGYTLSLQLRTDYGITDGVSNTLTRKATLRDHVIVSMGDSLASGEGAPDVLGEYSVNGYDPDTLQPNGFSRIRQEQWQDRRCHRSARSGPAVAAKALEDADAKTSVTFLSVACSSAQLRHLLTDQHEGIAPDGTLVAPQIDAVKKALTPPSTTLAQRGIDALLISIGLNDLDFSDIIRACALNNNNNPWGDAENCVTDTGIAAKMADLPVKYDVLATALRTKLAYVRETYLNDYPGNLFQNGACGNLGLPGVGINAVEGSEMSMWGGRLSRVITNAMRKYRSDGYRWNTVDHLSATFASHLYTCNGAGWYTSYGESWTTQGDEQGTAHPNAAGAQAYGQVLRKAIVLDQTLPWYRKVTVRIDSVKAASVAGSPQMNLSLSNQVFQNDESPVTRSLYIPRNGQWTAVPSTVGTFTTYMHLAPASPRHGVQISLSVGKILPIKHTRSDGYGAGSREVVHPNGTLAVRYRVTVEEPPPVIG